MARKSHQDSAVRFVRPPRLGSTICYGQELARKSHQDSPVRFVKAKTLARKSHQDSAVRFVTAKSWPERATKIRQYDLLRPRRWPEKATKTRQYDLLRPNVGQKEPPRLGSTNCCGQTWARKSHQDSAVRFVTAKRGPERATKTRQYDLLRPNVGQKEPPRLGSTNCYGPRVGQKKPPRLRKSHQDSAVRFVAAKRAPRLGNTIYYGQEWARKSHQDSAVQFVTAKRGPERATKTRQYDLLRPTETATETRQYDLLRPNVGQKEPKTRQSDLLRPSVGQKKPARLGSTICYGQECGQKEPTRLGSTTCYGQTWARKSYRRFVTAKSWPERTTKTRRCDLLRPRVSQKEPPRLGSTICYGQELARKSHQDSAVRFVTAKSWPERATKTRQYDLLRPRVGQKEPPCDLLRPRVGKKEPPRLGSTICCGQEFGHKKSHQDSAVRFVAAKSWPERATKTRQYDLLRPNVGQKEPLKTRQYGVVTAKSWPERATNTRQSHLLRRRVNQKEPPRPASTICYQKKPPRLGNTICYGQTWAKSGPERFGNMICYGQEWARKRHQDSAVRFVTAKSGPERTNKTRQYHVLQPRVRQKEPPRLGSTICYGQELARKSHQDPAVRFVTAKRGPE